jgi:nickel-dependent lactate racemase
MRVRLEYGRSGLDVELPGHRVVRTLSYRPVPPLDDPSFAVRQALLQPSGTAPLADVAPARKSACVVVCDITRPVPNAMILRPILDTLESAGIPRERITILIATGLHRPNEGDELVEIVGSYVAENYRVENHHGECREEHTYLGESPQGVPIWIDSRYLDADLKITVGLIEPHFMAGFSGGRKLICPGIAGVDTIRAWHSPRFLEHPNADTGILEGNPVHEENTWIARRAGCDFMVNVVIDDQRRPLKFFAGDMVAALLEGVDFVRGIVSDFVPEPVDVVVTTSAGYPLDTTFYQSVKGLVGALPIVKRGGTIVLAAGLAEGVGSPDFRRCLKENPDLEAFMQRISSGDYFIVDQCQLEKLVHVVRKAHVTYVTDGLTPEAFQGLHVNFASSVEQAVADALDRHGDDATIAVIPKGPYVVAGVAA